MEHLKYVAISNKYPEVGVIDENGNAFHKDTDEKIELDNDVVDQEFESLKLEEQATQYQRDRAVAYDPIPEQLDQIYHDIDAWKAKIKAVKDKYPKP